MTRFSFSGGLNANFARSLFSRRASRKVRRPPGPRFLRLEALERRTLLCANPFLVCNLNDAGLGSLRQAILDANAKGGTELICFANDLYGSIKLTSGALAISAENLTINGPGENQLTVSGNNLSRVFDIGAGATVKIDNLTIADGKTVGGGIEADAGNGGGILNEAGATLNLGQVVVTDNSAYADSSGNNGNGGGIENAGSLTIVDSTFMKNLASGGQFTSPTDGCGGGAIDTTGRSLTVTDSTFTNNQVIGLSTGASEGNGGAINNISSIATITNCTFDGNQALGRLVNGGAISTGEVSGVTCPTTISNSTFTGNQAVGANGANDETYEDGGGSLGGAIENGFSPMTITNSTVTDNLAKGGDHGDNTPADNATDGGGFVGFVWGGGIINYGGTLTVTNTVVSGNRAIGGNSAAGVGGSALGGGIMSGFGSSSFTNVTFVGNQVIAGSGGPGYAGGSAFGGGFYNGLTSTAVVSHALFINNWAVGGAGGSKAAGGDAGGGAIANGGGYESGTIRVFGLPPDASSLTLATSTLICNVAQGGAGGAGGGNGGSGLGGGCYVLGTTTASPGGTLTTAFTTASSDATQIIANSALAGSPGSGGGASGQGVGGGLYIDTGAVVTLSPSVEVVFNFASTSDDNIFGTYTVN